jgi:branched-chain amino acid transport system substrate-binding protein
MRKAVILAVTAVALVAGAAALGVGGSSAGQARPGVNAAAQITCGNTRTIGTALPITGPAASIGTQQRDWARFFRTRYNRGHKKKIRLVEGDTQLPDTAQAIRVAESMASNSAVLGLVGPSGSQEVQVSTAPLRSGGLGNVSSSATRTSLTDGSRRGYFFRVVPNDDQQGPRVASYIRTRSPRGLGARRVVVVDAQNSYSTGLSDTVERILRGAGLTVQRESVSEANTTDFSSLIARIPRNTQVVYIPWQLAGKAQIFGTQLRASGRSATLFGSDGLFDPDSFKIPGSRVSFFPYNTSSAVLRAYRRSHGGKSDAFGLPTYVATQVVVAAVDKACANNQATRAEVRRFIARTNIPKAQSLLGFRVGFFNNNPRGPQGPGDLKNPANFGIYRITNSGAYVRVA